MRGEQNEQDEQWPFRIKVEGHKRRSEQDSDSVVSEQRRMISVELGRRGMRQSIEDLRAEFRRELRAQQAKFLQARAELQAQQEEAIANAWAVLGSSMTGMWGPENESTRAQTNVEVGQHTPVVNALLDAASEQSIQSPSGFGGVQTPSIYLTPAEGGNPVYLNASNYFTPELYSPMDMAYYTAPCTCVPASSRCQTEQTPHFHGSGVEWSPTSKQDNGMESSITPSCETSGADSGYSRIAGSGTSVSGPSVSKLSKERDKLLFLGHRRSLTRLVERR